MTAYDPSAPVINEVPVEHHCFGCGDANPIGLRLRFRERPGGGVWALFTPKRAHEGYLGMTHGGIVATLLDEAMSWAVTTAGDFGVTARMAMTFRQPARVYEELRVVGWIVQRRGRVTDARGEVFRAGDDTLVAEAEARFVRVSREQAEEWRVGYGVRTDAVAAAGGSCSDIPLV